MEFEFVYVWLLVVDVVSLLPIRRLGSLREREDEEVLDDICGLAGTDDVDLSSIDPFLDDVNGTDVADGTRPSRLRRWYVISLASVGRDVNGT